MKKVWLIIGIVSLLTVAPAGSLSAQPLLAEADGPLSTLSEMITSTLPERRVAPDHIGRPSPAGCVTRPQWPHISSTEGGGSIISYKGDTRCNRVVTFEMEIWGDRHTWLGWRQHTDTHHTETFHNTRRGTIRTTKAGRRGTYTYRTRLLTKTLENGVWSMVRDLASEVNVRISCPGNGGACTEIARDPA